MNRKKVILITNMPAPYRVKQYDLINENLDFDFFILYTQNDFSKTSLKWNRAELKHKHAFINNNNILFIISYIQIIKFLFNFNPVIVITAGFNLSMLIGFIYSKILKKKHVVFTDTWEQPVNLLSGIHKLIRKIVIKFSDGFICVGNKGREYLIKYGANPLLVFISRLSDEINFQPQYEREKEYDIIYSGQIIDRKQPLFFVDVAYEISKYYKGIKILVLGNGPKENEMIKKLEAYNLDYKFEGYVSPKVIKDFYYKAKILLFPTLSDPWGMVANDALSLGIPVITTKYAGCANDLVINNYNGFILDLDKNIWRDKVLFLLKNKKEYIKFSRNSLNSIQGFTLEKAAFDFTNALNEISKTRA